MEKEELQILENSMSREDIIRYAGKIKPVMMKDGKLWWIESKKIHGESCTYDPTYLEEVKSILVPLRTIETYHKYGGYYAFLRPSVDEAIFQCPKDILEEVTAFEFIIPENLMTEAIYNSKLDRHVLQTRYYTGIVPEEVLKRDIEW